MNNGETETYTLMDEQGVETLYDLVDVIKQQGEKYFALVPHEEESEELLILKEVLEKGEKKLVPIKDEEEFSKIGELFYKNWTK